MTRPLRVCYFGTYDRNYSRNRILIDGLKRNGVEVLECHLPLWAGTQDKVDMAKGGGWRHPKFWGKLIRTYRTLFAMEKQLPPYDVLVLGYSGHIDAFPAALIARRRRVPLVLDVFMSLWLIIQERKINKRNPLSSGLVRCLEWLALRVPDRLIIDTPEYRRFMCATYGIKPDRFSLIPTGADDSIFTPDCSNRTPAEEIERPFTVLQYGTFIPLHGIEIVLQAAEKLQQSHPGIRFQFIGTGQELPKAEQYAREHGLANVTFCGWMAKDRLVQEIDRADICLGVFGTTRQSRWTIQNKIYECLSMGKPLITGACPAVERAFTHGHALWLCERGNPQALSESIVALYDDPGLRRKLAEQGNAAFKHGRYGLQGLGQRMQSILEDAIRAYHRPKRRQRIKPVQQ